MSYRILFTLLPLLWLFACGYGGGGEGGDPSGNFSGDRPFGDSSNKERDEISLLRSKIVSLIMARGDFESSSEPAEEDELFLALGGAFSLRSGEELGNEWSCENVWWPLPGDEDFEHVDYGNWPKDSRLVTSLVIVLADYDPSVFCLGSSHLFGWRSAVGEIAAHLGLIEQPTSKLWDIGLRHFARAYFLADESVRPSLLAYLDLVMARSGEKKKWAMEGAEIEFLRAYGRRFDWPLTFIYAKKGSLNRDAVEKVSGAVWGEKELILVKTAVSLAAPCLFSSVGQDESEKIIQDILFEGGGGRGFTACAEEVSGLIFDRYESLLWRMPDIYSKRPGELHMAVRSTLRLGGEKTRKYSLVRYLEAFHLDYDWQKSYFDDYVSLMDSLELSGDKEKIAALSSCWRGGIRGCRYRLEIDEALYFGSFGDNTFSYDEKDGVNNLLALLDLNVDSPLDLVHWGRVSMEELSAHRTKMDTIALELVRVLRLAAGLSGGLLGESLNEDERERLREILVAVSGSSNLATLGDTFSSLTADAN